MAATVTMDAAMAPMVMVGVGTRGAQRGWGCVPLKESMIGRVTLRSSWMLRAGPRS
jgi:hypothetical protein